jgi:hypothetical protein
MVIPTFQEVTSEIRRLEQRSGIVFVGSFLHPPNVDSACFLVEQ